MEISLEAIFIITPPLRLNAILIYRCIYFSRVNKEFLQATRLVITETSLVFVLCISDKSNNSTNSWISRNEDFLLRKLKKYKVHEYILHS